jgi:hypothetical protein
VYLKAGDWVEVRSSEEILATLDERGRLENLPFMPEMLQYCGQRLRVFKRADKTCEYTQAWSIRRMKNAVHLEAVRCDGSEHSGCQANCLIFWKEAWLKPVNGPASFVSTKELLAPKLSPDSSREPRQWLVQVGEKIDSNGTTCYSCQATDVPQFTSRMRFWDPRQYIRDVKSGNLDSGLSGSMRGHRVLDLLLAVLRICQAALIGFFNEIQDRRGGTRYPFIEGTSTDLKGTPLDLRPGDLVEVRSKEEIMATLDKGQKNRGLWFDSEMLPYCGGIYRVLRRVNRIIDEKTGKMIQMKNPCIMLDGVVCKSDYHRLCPRAIYPYWRESWLKRATSDVPEAELAERVCR